MEKQAVTALFRKGFARAARKKPLVPKSLVKGITAKGGGHINPQKALEGYKRQAKRRGIDSFTTFLPTWAAEKMLGKDKVRNAVWKAVSKPALVADTAAGNVLKKIPGAKKLFTTTEKIPWGKRNDLYRQVQRSSALAPIVKVRQFAAPVIVGVGLEKGIDKAVGYTKQPKKNQAVSNTKTPMMTKSALAEKLADKDLREKAASVMLHLHQKNEEHEKRAHALRLLYKQAEMGFTEMPASYNELEEKIASLVTQDLAVVEKALELTGGQTMLGELASNIEPSVRNANEQFQAAIIGNDHY